MLLSKLMADVEARAGVSRVFQIILGISLLLNLLLAAVLLTMDKSVRTVLVPPEIHKSFWVDGHNISPEYLEEMGTWAVGLFATVTPENFDYQTAQLLKYVHPSVHGDLVVRFNIIGTKIKQDSISKIFFPREVLVNEKGKSVALIGYQHTYIADKRIPGDDQKAFLVTFGYDGSRTFIKELREANPSNPFAAPVPQAADAQQETLPPSQPQRQVTPVSPVEQTSSAAPAAATPGALPPPPSTNNAAAQESLQSGSLPQPSNNNR